MIACSLNLNAVWFVFWGFDTVKQSTYLDIGDCLQISQLRLVLIRDIVYGKIRNGNRCMACNPEPDTGNADGAEYLYAFVAD